MSYGEALRFDVIEFVDKFRGKSLPANLTYWALTKLRRLIRQWGGTIDVIRGNFITYVENLDQIRKRDYFPATFNLGLGLFYGEKKIVISSPISRHLTADIIHECAHIFATRYNPNDSDELAILGWEMLVAKLIGMPLSVWGQSCKDYDIEGVIEDENFPTLVGKCSEEQLQVLYQDRVSYAKHIGIIDEKGNPLAVR
jgi:hypothetical protein